MFFPKKIPEDIVLYILEYHPIIAKSIRGVKIWHEDYDSYSDITQTNIFLFSQSFKYYISWSYDYNIETGCVCRLGFDCPYCHNYDYRIDYSFDFPKEYYPRHLYNLKYNLKYL